MIGNLVGISLRVGVLALFVKVVLVSEKLSEANLRSLTVEL